MSITDRDGGPDRLYTLTRGRSRPGNSFDLVTLIVSECEPDVGMQSEHARILRLCRFPSAVVEVAAELGLPVSITKILLSDLLDMGMITARHPRTAARGLGLGAGAAVHLPDPDLLEQVLVGLRNL